MCVFLISPYPCLSSGHALWLEADSYWTDRSVCVCVHAYVEVSIFFLYAFTFSVCVCVCVHGKVNGKDGAEPDGVYVGC